MEKIKDFLYEKSDIFFASIVVVLVTTVVLYNLNGWLVIDGEASRYHEIPVTNEDGKKPSDSALAANPEKDKKDNEKSESEKQTDKKEDTGKSKGESKTEQNKKDAEKTKQEKTEADKKAQEQKKSEQKPQDQKNQEKTEQKKPEQKKQEKKASNRSITIASGSTAKSIANSLKSQGIISDTNAFLNSLVASGKETKLKAGTFTIPEGSSNDQIISILTK